MDFEDEKDYIMRIIKEMVRMLFALLFGKKPFPSNRNRQANMKYPAGILLTNHSMKEEQ